MVLLDGTQEVERRGTCQLSSRLVLNAPSAVGVICVVVVEKAEEPPAALGVLIAAAGVPEEELALLLVFEADGALDFGFEDELGPNLEGVGGGGGVSDEAGEVLG